MFLCFNDGLLFLAAAFATIRTLAAMKARVWPARTASILVNRHTTGLAFVFHMKGVSL